MVLSSTPIAWDFERWRRTLLAYRIDGRPMLDLSRAEHAQGLARLMAMETQTRVDRTFDDADWIEPCPHVLARTAGQRPITDDNMGTEWRHFWEQQ